MNTLNFCPKMFGTDQKNMILSNSPELGTKTAEKLLIYEFLVVSGQFLSPE